MGIYFFNVEKVYSDANGSRKPAGYGVVGSAVIVGGQATFSGKGHWVTTDGGARLLVLDFRVERVRGSIAPSVADWTAALWLTERGLRALRKRRPQSLKAPPGITGQITGRGAKVSDVVGWVQMQARGEPYLHCRFGTGSAEEDEAQPGDADEQEERHDPFKPVAVSSQSVPDQWAW